MKRYEVKGTISIKIDVTPIQVDATDSQHASEIVSNIYAIGDAEITKKDFTITEINYDDNARSGSNSTN